MREGGIWLWSLKREKGYEKERVMKGRLGMKVGGVLGNGEGKERGVLWGFI